MDAVEEARKITELKNDLLHARSQLVELLGVLDDIELRQKPLVEMDYALKIGVWEAELAKSDLAARRAKRRYELAQAQANRGRPVDFQLIDEMLDAELEEWVVQANARVAAWQASVERRAGMGYLTSAEAHELKTLHRKLVKRLHPDLNPGDSEAERLFNLVRTAYENGDLNFLRSLDVATMGRDSAPDELSNDADSLYVDIELARAQAVLIEERIEAEQKSEPLAFKNLLEDADWVESRIAPLRNRIEELSEIQSAYEKRAMHLKGDSDDR